MSKKTKIFLLLLCACLTVIFVASCGEKTPYEQNDLDGYTVSIKYDSNGGLFTTGTTVIVDSYELEALKANAEGNKEVALIAPEDQRRGKGAFMPSKAGYFLAGWYTEKNPVVDEKGNHLDINGNIASETGLEKAYTYSGRWDFNSTYELDSSKQYTSAQPALTLYAGWMKEFKYEFYDAETGDLLDEYTFNPLSETSITVPEWNTETGKLDMYKFPQVKDKTLEGIYYDEAMQSKVTTETVEHTGEFSLADTTSQNEAMKLYVDYKDGNWIRVTNVSHITKNDSSSGCYEILADLDFTGAIWPTTFTTQDFTGKIIGNGHTISNVTIEQTNNKRQFFGMFGQITSTAQIENIAFTNVTATISSGTNMQDGAFGLLAGNIQGGATLSEITISSAKLLFSPNAYFRFDNYTVGLLCGQGYSQELGIDISGITAEALEVEASSKTVTVTVSGNDVTLAFEKKQ